MAAIGVLLIGFGGLTTWAALDKTIVFDILRSMLGLSPVQRTAEGQVQTASSITTTIGAGDGSAPSSSAPAGSSPNFNPNAPVD